MTLRNIRTANYEAQLRHAIEIEAQTATLVTECGGRYGEGPLCDSVEFDTAEQGKEFMRKWSALVGLDPPDFAV